MIVASLLLAAAPADEPDCSNGDLPQQVLNICAAREAEAADAAMNAQWKLTVETMKARDREIDRTYDKQPGYFETLLAAQRAWLTYRDKQCLVASFEMRGGSGAPMIHGGCMAELTRARTAQLKALIETGN
jgi:uncharacterized protein YecT (DUF1311 family)